MENTGNTVLNQDVTLPGRSISPAWLAVGVSAAIAGLRRPEVGARQILPLPRPLPDRRILTSVGGSNAQ